MTRPAPALVQTLGAVLLLGSSWPITRYALLGRAAPFWFALGRLRRPARRGRPALLALGLLQPAGFFALAHSAVAWVPAGATVPARRAP